MSKKLTVTRALNRREILTGTAVLLVGASVGHARPIFNGLPLAPDFGSPPNAWQTRTLALLHRSEARAMEAIGDWQPRQSLRHLACPLMHGSSRTLRSRQYSRTCATRGVELRRL
jgi:hypothetical protein